MARLILLTGVCAFLWSLETVWRLQPETDSNYANNGLGGFDENQTLRRLLLTIAMVSVLMTASLSASAPAEEAKRTVVFMCPYGGAKSVIAMSYFNQLAERDSLPYVAAAVAGETPYEAVPENVAAFLANQGFTVTAFKPRRVAPKDLESASRVVSIDCDLTKVDSAGVTIERWDDVPKVSVDLPASAAAIRKHVETLVAQLKGGRR